MPCSGFGRDMPLAVYKAQNLRGGFDESSAPIASSTGSTNAVPAIPFSTARLSIRQFMALGPWNGFSDPLGLFLQKEIASYDFVNDVSHARLWGIAEGTPLFQSTRFIVSQTSADGVDRQMLNHAVGDLIEQLRGQ